MPVDPLDTPGAGSPLPSPTRASQTLDTCQVCRQPVRSVFNPLVPCRLCRRRWHRLCHVPVIADYVAAAAAAEEPAAAPAERNGGGKKRSERSADRTRSDDQAARWTCPACTAAAAQDERTTKRRKIEASLSETLPLSPRERPATADAPPVSWADRPLAERQAYIAGLPQRALAQLLMRAVELHPDLPIFPGDGGKGAGGGARAATTGRTEKAAKTVDARPYRNGIINSIRKSAPRPEASTPAPATAATPSIPPKRRTVVIIKRRPPGTTAQAADVPSFAATPIDADEEDPTGLMALWPRPGQGLYARLGGDGGGEDEEGGAITSKTTALADKHDHAAFSTVLYDAAGRKVSENGMPVLVLP